jgi:AcrR family transcriptional regulator
MGKGKGRVELTKERILDTALTLADEIGIAAFTIRRLAAALGSPPMSIYHYFPSKESIIDGMVESVFGEITLPPKDGDWKSAMMIRCSSAREVLHRHPWAPPLMESRSVPGPAQLRHHDANIGCLRRGGLSIEMTARGMAIIDAFLFGFALQETSLPGGGGEEMIQLGADFLDGPFRDYPNLVELTRYTLKPGYRFEEAFSNGLDLILEGLERVSDPDR